MAQLAISDDLMAKIAAIAQTRALPVEQQVEEMLTDAVRRTDDKADLRARFAAIRALTPNVPQTDSTLLIREDRDR